jgi:hypothetical protein
MQHRKILPIPYGTFAVFVDERTIISQNKPSYVKCNGFDTVSVSAVAIAVLFVR